MKKIFGILVFMVFLSCEENRSVAEVGEAENLTPAQIDSVLAKFKFQYDSPIILDSTNQALIPISTEFLKTRKRYSKDGYYSDEYPRYWNVLFYNLETGENRLLTESKYRISVIYANANPRSDYHKRSKILQEKVFYEISDIDFNKDNKLDGDDPEFLFVSEINGDGLKRISPINEDLQYFEIIPKSEKLLIRTLRDVNQDSLFNKKDEYIWYMAELKNNDWTIKEMIDSMQRRKIENLYFEQWVKKRTK